MIIIRIIMIMMIIMTRPTDRGPAASAEGGRSVRGWVCPGLTF